MIFPTTSRRLKRLQLCRAHHCVPSYVSTPHLYFYPLCFFTASPRILSDSLFPLIQQKLKRQKIFSSCSASMGHGSSRSKENGNGTPDSNGSRLSRFRRRLHLHRHQHHRLFHRRSRGHGSSSGSNLKVLDAEDFAGIAILTLIGV